MGRKRRRKKELRGKREREARAAPEERAALALDALGRETRAQEALMREAAERKAAARARDQLKREARARELEDEYRQKMERLRRKRSHGQERAAPARQRPAQRPSVSSRTRVRAEVRIRKTPAEPDGRQAEKHPAEDLPVVEVRDGVGWEVLLDGQARVVMCGEGTPFGSARNFQMSVGPAARSRGLVASTRREGDRVRVEARPGPRVGERPARRARYRWDEWLDGEPHEIPLGPESEFPGVRSQQLVDAALRAGKVRGLKVATQVRDGGLVVALHASPPKPVVRAGKYPWGEWFNGDEHHVDLADARWGHPRPDSFRISVKRAAQRHGVEACLIPAVDQAVLDANPAPRAWNAAVRQSTEWVVRANRLPS